MATTVQSIDYRLKQFWIANPSQSAIEEIGPLAATMKKGPRTAIGGNLYFSSNGDAQWALQTQGSMNVGSDKANAFAASKTEGGARGITKACRYYSIFRMDADELMLTDQDDAAVSDEAVGQVMTHLIKTQQNFWRSFSAYSWRDGRGGVAGLATTSAVGTTITLANPDMIRAFEVDDVLVAYDPATYFVGPCGVLATPRAGTVTVTGRDEDNGRLTLSAAFNVGITGGAAGDIIGHRDYRQPAGNAFTAGLYGVGTYVAFRTSDQAGTHLNINRSLDPGRTSGRLDTTLGTNAPITEVMNRIGTIAGRYGIKPDMVFCSSREYMEIAREYQNKRVYQEDVKKLRFGVEGAEFEGPGFKATLVCDPYLWDINTNDRLFVALEMNDWRFVTTKEGVGWRKIGRPEGQGYLIDTNGLGDLTAQYGAVGQNHCQRPYKAVVVRVPA